MVILEGAKPGFGSGTLLHVFITFYPFSFKELRKKLKIAKKRNHSVQYPFAGLNIQQMRLRNPTKFLNMTISTLKLAYLDGDNANSFHY